MTAHLPAYEDTILYKEIQAQPETLQQLLDSEAENAWRIADSVRGRFHTIMIAARGSSDNAARYAQYLFGANNSLSVALATPSLFTQYKRPPNLKGCLVMAISQSGRSRDIIEVAEEGRRQGAPTIAITNNPESPLAAATEFRLNLHAGKERAVAATKTYTASLAALALLSASFAKSEPRMEALQALPAAAGQTLSGLMRHLDRVERYRYMEHCAVIGRGYNYATAFEIALKIKELTGVVAEPYSPPDFLHGPIVLARSGFPTILVGVKGAVLEDVQELARELDNRGAEIIVVSDQPGLLNAAKLALPIPQAVPEWLSPVISVLPGQLFALVLAVARGMNPDHPPGLQKVTITH